MITQKSNAREVSYKELKERAKLFELIADHAPALISYIDKNERYHFSNNTYKEWLGFSKDEIFGKTVKEIRGKAAYKEIRPHLRKALAGEEVKYDNVLYKKDGKRLYITTRFVPHRNAQGSVEGVIGLVLDITERKLAEERLKKKEEQFRHLVDANVIGVIIASLDGAVYEANDIFLKMVGYTREELRTGRIDWIKLTAPEYQLKIEKNEKEVLTKGAITPFEKEYIRKDGTRIHALVGDVLLDKAQRKTIAFILDITKQKELEKRKDEFIALASHELKTPLTSLKMYGELIQRYSKDMLTEKSARLLTNMDKQIDKLAELVDDLLDVSRIQSGKLQYKNESFVVDKLVKETVEELQRVSKRHKIVVQGKTGQTVRADRERIRQVITNLITNAIKYSPKADRIVIELHKNHDEVQISVQDFGIGIPQNQKAKIFDRFFQVDRPMGHTYPGLGLGLFITKEILDRHKGRIWVDSKKGEGTTFYFTLPIGKRSNFAKNNKNP